jgi:hypothetical protein
MPDFQSRLLQEIAAAPSRADAMAIVQQAMPQIQALGPEAEDALMVQITDALAELPDEEPRGTRRDARLTREI